MSNFITLKSKERLYLVRSKLISQVSSFWSINLST